MLFQIAAELRCAGLEDRGGGNVMAGREFKVVIVAPAACDMGLAAVQQLAGAGAKKAFVRAAEKLQTAEVVRVFHEWDWINN